MLKIIKPFFIIIASLLTLASCSQNSQYTNKMAADPFVAPLNSKTTKMVALDLKAGQKIAWLGLDHAADYKYFQVDEVKLNGKNFKPKSPGPEYVYSSFPPVAAIAGVPQESATTVYVTITFKAKKPHADDKPNEPYKAYLMAVLEGEKQGSVLINLEGYVRGVCDDCKLPLDKSFKYTLADNDGDGKPDFGLFLCDSKALAGKVQPNNQPADKVDFHIPADSKSSSDYRFDFVNLTGDDVGDWKKPPVDFVLYESDKKPGFIVIDAGDFAEIAPTVPPFNISVPGGKPVKTVDVKIADNFQAACPVDSKDSTFMCSDDKDSGIELRVYDSVGLNVTPLTLTTGSVAVASKDCPNFGTWTGSGKVDGVDDLKLVGFAAVSDDQPDVVKSAKTDIEGAAIVAVIKLVPVKE